MVPVCIYVRYIYSVLQRQKGSENFTFAEQTTSAKEKNLALTDYNAYQGGNPISPYSDNAKLIDQKIISKSKTRFYLDPVNEPK